MLRVTVLDWDVRAGGGRTWSAADMRDFLERNGLTSPAEMPLLDGQRLEGLDWNGADAGGVEAAMAHRRLYNLTGDLELNERLLGRGLRSAAQIAALPERHFAREHAVALGLSSAEAGALHRRAVRVQSRTLHLMANVHGLVAQPHVRAMRVHAVAADVVEHFERLPSYQEMFGSLDYCDCEHCRSIFGPAAYLVDLLRIVDARITTLNSIPTGLSLHERRPDIAKIPLTCAMTNDVMPYVELAVERLLETAMRLLQVASADEVRVKMATTLVYPVGLPCNVYLDRVRALLVQAGSSLADVFAAWAPATKKPDVVAEALGLSRERYEIVTTAKTSAATVAPFYGVSASELPALNSVELFVRKTGLTVAGVEDLVVQGLTADEIVKDVPQHLFVNQGAGTAYLTIDVPDDDAATIKNLDAPALDRLNRLRRLASTCGWSASETDWALRAAGGGTTPVIDDAHLAGVLAVKRAAERFGLPVVQATAFFGPLKTYGQDGDAGMSLFDQLFNSPDLVSRRGAYRPQGKALNPLYQDAPLTWTPGASTTLESLLRVLPGLALSVDDATALGSAIFAGNSVVLDVAGLSALYRHALLSRCVNLPMDRYLLLVDLLKLKSGNPFTGVELERVADRAAWMSASRIDVFHVAYAARGDASVYVDPILADAQVKPWLPGLVDTVPAGAPDVDVLVDAQIAILLGLEPSLVTAARKLAVKAQPPAHGTWTDLFLAPFKRGEDPPHLTYVTDVLRRIARWASFTRAANVPAEVLACVAVDPPSFGLPQDISDISVESLEDIGRFAQMIKDYGDRRGDLIRYVELSATTPDSASARDALCAATGWEPGQVKELLDQEVKGVVNAVARLRALAACLGQARSLGADVALMRGVAALAGLSAAIKAGRDDFQKAARVLTEKLSGSYGPVAWSQVGGEVEGRLRDGERDALIDVVLSLLAVQYDDVCTANDVYEYLLTDVQIGPQAQISKIREALNAVQLYLQRCRLRVERGVEAVEIPEAWWDWLLDYRKWEANRRVFLYPENYLVPSVRSDQTAPFRALAGQLLQSEITPTYVEQAYGQFVEDLLATTDLTPVDVWEGEIRDERGAKTRALYVFARTATAPYTFYLCRRLEGARWSQWEKIDVPVTAPHLTAVHAFDRMFVFWVRLERQQSPLMSMPPTSTTESKPLNTRASIAFRATIQYAFQNPLGGWSPPQQLTRDELVGVELPRADGPKLLDHPLFDDAYVMEQLVWQRVLAIHVREGNVAPGLAVDANSERLVVIYGAALTDTPLPAPPISLAGDNPDARAFAQVLLEKAVAHNRLADALASGTLSAGLVFVLDASLEANPVTGMAEMLATDPYWAKAPVTQHRADVDDVAGTVQLVRSSSPIGDLYQKAMPSLAYAPPNAARVESISFRSPGVNKARADAIFSALKTLKVIDGNGNVDASKLAALDLYELATAVPQNSPWPHPIQLQDILRVLLENVGAPVLFGAVDPGRARTLPTQGQPGTFMLDNGDEALLLRALPSAGVAPYSSLSDGLVVSATPFDPHSFIVVVPGGQVLVTYETSKKILAEFLQQKLIDDRGIPDTLAIRARVGTVLDGLVNRGVITATAKPLVERIARNDPIVYTSQLEVGRIGPDLAKKIQAKLTGDSESMPIDRTGRVRRGAVTMERITQLLSGAVEANDIGQTELIAIYRTLTATPVTVSLAYVNRAGPPNANTQFETIRLTTAAMPRLARALRAGGIDRLLDLRMQDVPVIPILPFERLAPAASVSPPEPADAAQVDFDGLYGTYFWELFFHGPMLVASMLVANERFREALTWFHHVFDPSAEPEPLEADTFEERSDGRIPKSVAENVLGQLETHTIGSDGEPIVKEGWVNPAFGPKTDLTFLTGVTPEQLGMVRSVLLNARMATRASRFWRFRRFRNHTLAKLREDLTDAAAIRAYEDHPFDPFAIARLRMGAFEKAIVMQYVDALIKWGDHYFAQDTWESITAASMLYVYAGELLGPRPQQIEPSRQGAPATFEQIRTRYLGSGGIPPFLIYLESILPPPPADNGVAVAIQEHGFNDLGAYFCVPENQQLIGYWDRVEDRLYKIRSSLNLQGERRALALYEPPLDPMSLVRARAASNDVMPPAADLDVAVPLHRFDVVLGRARLLADTVSRIDATLLGVLERQDAEGLTLLQTTHQAELLALTTDLKQRQIDEIAATILSLRAALEGATTRANFFRSVLGTNLLASEQANLDASVAAVTSTVIAGALSTASSIGYALPQLGSPFAITYGGIQVGSMVQAAAGAAGIAADISRFAAERSLTMAGYERRREDWQLQLDTAERDVDSLKQQIAASEARLAAARRELAINQREIAQVQQVDAYLRSRFTSRELYGWMAGRLSAIHYQTYLLALQAARSAEKAFQFEHARTDTFLDLNVWDAPRRGLLAGEALTLTLDRMQAAAGRVGDRSLDVERVISLAQLDPLAFDLLRTHGKCSFELPELLFDYDYPGHYRRQLKSVSLSIPAVVGPYENIKATLTQDWNAVVLKPDLDAVRHLIDKSHPAPEGTVRTDWGVRQRVAISRGIDDSGWFSLDFGGTEYLPFEGTGAVSRWTLEMPPQNNRFDLGQLSDVLMTIRYTARPDDGLADSVRTQVLANKPLVVGYYVDAKRDLPLEWESFMDDHRSPSQQVLTFEFVPQWGGKLTELKLTEVVVRFKTTGVHWPASVLAFGTLTIGATSRPLDVAPDPYQRHAVATVTGLDLLRDAFSGVWSVSINLDTIRADHALHPLMSNSWLNPNTFLGIELMDVCEAKTY